MPFDAVFAALVTNTTRVIGNGPAGYYMYSSLALPWTAQHLLGDQRAAGAIALGIGEVALVVAVAALLVRGAGLAAFTGPVPEGQRPAELTGRLLDARAHQ